ncbi:2-succinyl-5-enolpyruvyl-6-hydroxy-3-cyclohexene-1-carboxylic-acid synthase [Alicyclobacillus sp. SO9]|uniref:2-succinyl-5-enolpyruvyl-6-hydroxy-3- cyclohexene-1-carboxylic-acid synthase n=1 Tax=Alicyclobacillus sp. SO9 TaxID=2665646 RepID=UPI0018E78119|nr:2-succinyl-5-enolpyruvyl-6-hydroxy-3-cyclohexene-1-carboxylic-acid synthase [Alicyclobacillus sp. SO9]QQE77162.1 2-succinyl-5-enolpyruvyl-6-hydroxy-3-cyclohexene-1-carboxylic-acid synthase [Alicyclobacillus sp. SO9]
MAENEHLALVGAFVEQLYHAGVRDVCISPGSRSTPFTMAFARHGKFSIWSILDERSSGFFAVGLARAKLQPVALVCTSGTAVGNYLPAVMEAHNARLPLLLLTGDRPPELYDSGANQTSFQRGILAPFVKWEHQMPVPKLTDVLRRHARAAAVRAAAVCAAVPAGPVHVNWPFREPLIIPTETDAAASASASVEQHSHFSEIRVWPSQPKISETQMTQLHQEFHQYERGVIVCGAMHQEESAQAVVNLASSLGWPVIADPLSHLRTGNHRKEKVINTADLLLRSLEFQAAMMPELILRFGAAPTSKALLQYIERHAACRQAVVDANPLWRDPVFTTTDVIQADPVDFCNELAALAAGTNQMRSTWLEQWQALNDAANDLLQKAGAEEFWYEGQLVPELVEALPQRANVFIGNSMPIRDFDSFLALTQKSLKLFANRGVSGIDGVVSSALGVAAANPAEPTVLVIGDVSFYHDLNALLAAQRNDIDLLVVVVNNNGGGIFSFLPQAEYEDTFYHFRTPHGVNYSGTEQLYGAKYSTASSWTEFRTEMDSLVRESGLRVLELQFDTDDNVLKHKEIVERIVKGVEALL